MAQFRLPHPTSAGKDRLAAAIQEPQAAETLQAGSPQSILVVHDQPAAGLSVACS